MKYHRDDYTQFLFDEECAEADERAESREWRRSAAERPSLERLQQIRAELDETRGRMEKKKRAC